MATSCMNSSIMVCVPVASAFVVAAPSRCCLYSSSAAPLNAKWGQRVSLRARFMKSLKHEQTGAHFTRETAVAELSDFAVQESAKFREGLLQQLQANSTTASDKVKIVDVCAKIFGDYLDRYDGSLSPEPFGEMKEALDSQQLPSTELVICAAVGWSRGHLHHDWKMSQEKK